MLMHVNRSVSTSELAQAKIEDHAGMEIKYKNDTGELLLSISEKDAILSSKAQTLDRFARPSSMSQHGEKRKKNIFASFRLSKKSTSKRKEDGVTVPIPESSLSGSKDGQFDLLDKDENKISKEEINSNSLATKSRKRYLNRMSSFVTRVATKVHSGNDINYGFKSKLERSQTITGTDFSLEKIDYVSFENEVPGLIGIRNHGNTCFMNAVIQCLSHTDIIAEYFVLDQYKSDLARCNRINSKKYGAKGEITEHLAILLKSLWVLRYVPDISLNLKNIIEKYEPCYRGSNQHDAAEFLMFLLDKVHEDLNTASKRKYKKIKNTYGRPDEIVAAETLANHHRCNSSFVQDIFQAQFRSSLKCPHCLKESNTFDPYLCVSIPIPQHEVLSILVTVVYLNQQPKQVKIGVRIEATASVKQLRHVISTDCGICPEHLIITEIDGEGFHRTFEDNSRVNIIKRQDPIYAIEMTPPSTQETAAFIHIAWVNVLIADPDNIRFGGIYQSQVARDVTYEDLQKLLLKEMSSVVTSETLTSEQQRGIFCIALDNGSKNEVLLEADLDLPLLHQSIEDSLSICHPMAGPLHIKLVLQWNQENKKKYITDDVDHVDEHSSIEELSKKPQEYAPVSLADCLQLHTSSEMLSCGDAWHCPTCNRKQQVLKRLTLWSAPQILVIHLKRFRQASLGINSSKLDIVVNYPLTGFDISDHMAVHNCPDSNKVLSGVWSSWKRTKKMNCSDRDFVYDLFAVCNHHGQDLQGGHYTAACRNPTNNRWYLFDDFNIVEVEQETVVDQNAYILFYQRREEPSSPCSSTKTHWSFHIPNVSLPQILKIIPSARVSEDSTAVETKSAKDTNSIGVEDIKEINQDKNAAESVTSSVPALQDNEPGERGTSNDSVSKDLTQDSNSEKDENVTDKDPKVVNATESSDEEGSCCSSETIPEIRIQPASLEVLASHRRALHLPPRATFSSSTCSSTSSLSSGERNKELSSGDESTPEVRISHHQSRSASYVVIRTPTSKPLSAACRSSRMVKRSRESLHEDRTNGESGYGSHEDTELKPSKGSQTSTELERSKGSQTLKCYSEKRWTVGPPHSTVYKKHDKLNLASKIFRKPNPDPYKCKDNLNHYLTESSV